MFVIIIKIVGEGRVVTYLKNLRLGFPNSDTLLCCGHIHTFAMQAKLLCVRKKRPIGKVDFVKPEIDRDVLNTIGCDELFLLMVKPIALEMHSGKEPEHKYAVYKRLTSGQKVAFMYWVLYSHAAYILQFYTWIPYMRSPESDYWNPLKEGLQLMGCEEMLQFVETCDAVFSSLEQIKPDWAAFVPQDLEEPELKYRIQTLYAQFKELSQKTATMVGQYIKDNIHDFAKLV